ncbi:MAG: YdcF family protein [Pseudomonadota bacterium]
MKSRRVVTFLVCLLGLLILAGGMTSRAGGFLLCAAWAAGGTGASPGKGASPAQAIVVLTGGDARNAEAVRLHRASGLPVLASGGDGEARAIAMELAKNRVAIAWMEGDSRNTWENAVFSNTILSANGLTSIVLVTDSLHMWRARALFEDQGLIVRPAPVALWPFGSRDLQPRDFLPSREGIAVSKLLLHEVGGLVLYRVRRAAGWS